MQVLRVGGGVGIVAGEGTERKDQSKNKYLINEQGYSELINELSCFGSCPNRTPTQKEKKSFKKDIQGLDLIF